MSIYDAVNPSKWTDRLELETFTLTLEDEFSVHMSELQAAWHEDITLGDVFGLMGGGGK